MDQIGNQSGNTKCTLSSMKYELSLLKERNKILALENENLVLKIEELNEIINANNLSCKEVSKSLNFVNANRTKEKVEFQKLISSIKQIDKQSASINLISEMLVNDCPTYAVIAAITEAIDEKNEKSAKESEFSRLQRLVDKRKEKIVGKENKSKEVIHFVKEPSWKENNYQEADIDYVFRVAEKIIRKIKKEHIPNHQINSILDHIKDLLRFRTNLRSHERELKEREREVELGIGSCLLVEECSSKFLESANSQLMKQEEIEKRISAL